MPCHSWKGACVQVLHIADEQTKVFSRNMLPSTKLSLSLSLERQK